MKVLIKKESECVCQIVGLFFFKMSLLVTAAVAVSVVTDFCGVL